MKGLELCTKYLMNNGHKKKHLIVHMQDLTPETLLHVKAIILIFYEKFDFRVEPHYSLCSQFVCTPSAIGPTVANWSSSVPRFYINPCAMYRAFECLRMQFIFLTSKISATIDQQRFNETMARNTNRKHSVMLWPAATIAK